MARIVRRERRQRGFFGWIFLLLFWGFNALMLWWLVTGMAAVGRIQATSDAERAGQAIGGALGFWMIVSIWGSGALILGLFVLLTRGSTVVVEETGGSERGERYPEVDTSKWSKRDRDQYLAAQAREREDGQAPLRAVPQVDGPRTSYRIEPPSPSPVRRTAPPRPALPPQLAHDRGWFIEVVGEASYQDALADAADEAKYLQDRLLVLVTLEPEDDNPHDANAVRVAYRGQTVGYLPRAAAKQYRSALGQQASTCSGSIVGGGVGDEGEPMFYGIYLNAIWPPIFKPAS